ncbi:MAG: hypothetical protein Q4E61_04085 [Alphaproteobacteria bacterium]|nr:hypothetical protein [Alphaproteobacteria bacterium]
MKKTLLTVVGIEMLFNLTCCGMEIDMSPADPYTKFVLNTLGVIDTASRTYIDRLEKEEFERKLLGIQDEVISELKECIYDPPSNITKDQCDSVIRNLAILIKSGNYTYNPNIDPSIKLFAHDGQNRLEITYKSIDTLPDLLHGYFLSALKTAIAISRTHIPHNQ